MPLSLSPPAIPVHRGHAGQGRNLLVTGLAQDGQFGEQCGGRDYSDARHALENLHLLGPIRVALEKLANLLIQGRDLLLQPFQMLLDGGADDVRGRSEAVFFGDPHLYQLATAGDQGLQPLPVLIGDWRDWRMKGFPVPGQDVGINPVGLRQRSGRVGEFPNPPGVDPGGGKARQG